MTDQPIKLPATILGYPVVAAEVPSPLHDGCFTFATPGAGDITLDDLLALVKKVEGLPKPEHDCFICLPGVLEQLPRAAGGEARLDRLTGIPVYEAANDTEALTGLWRVWVLQAGVRGEGEEVRGAAAPRAGVAARTRLLLV